MFKIYSSKEIGEYISKLVKSKFKNERQFCKRCVELQNLDPTDEEIHKMQDRFSHIKKGTRNIQVEDLPIFTELLMVSCEQILTAGHLMTPIKNRMTNYEIAFSDNPEVWKEYIEREDKLFLNADEYCKTVIDYAFEFKNYPFIKYLIDGGYIWFVDNSKWIHGGAYFGAGTSVKRREIGHIDCDLPLEIQYEDKFRTKLIALALENHDFDILDTLRARETPPLYYADNLMSYDIDIAKYRNEEMIRQIAVSDEKTLDYFSSEFDVRVRPKENHTFMFADIDRVINIMLANDRKEVELLIRRVIKHNKETYESVVEMIDEAIKFQAQSDNFPDIMMSYYKRVAYEWLNYNDSNHMLAYYFCKGRHDCYGMITNIFEITGKASSALINELIEEANMWFRKAIDLRKEKDNV